MWNLGNKVLLENGHGRLTRRSIFALSVAELVTRLLLLLGSRHTTRPAHAGVGGHRTTVSPLFFIAYPQTRVPAPSMLGPYADATGRSLQPMLDCSNPASLDPRTRTQYLQIWTPMSFSDITLFHVSSSSSRHAPART